MAKKNSVEAYAKRFLRKKRMAFMSNISRLAAMKLTENGSPTLPNTGYAEIARRIRAIRPELSGGVQQVMADFVGQGVEAQSLQAKVVAQKSARADTQRSWAAYKLFYETEAWRRVRYEALRLHGGMCCLCGATAHQGAVLHVDHIKPRSLHPELELDVNNLQVLCADCNVGKSNLDETDWREDGRRPATVSFLLSEMHKAVMEDGFQPLHWYDEFVANNESIPEEVARTVAFIVTNLEDWAKKGSHFDIPNLLPAIPSEISAPRCGEGLDEVVAGRAQ